MLKPTVKRGLMIDFIPDKIICPTQINQNRVFPLNDKGIKRGEIVYIMTREFRLEDNWAFIFASELSQKYKKNLKIIIHLDAKFYSKHQLKFMMEGLNFLKKNLAQNNICFEILERLPPKFVNSAGAIIVDFNPINLKTDFAKELDCAVFEVDSHNIIPARFISNKQEFSAATLRRKTYANLAGFLTEFPNFFQIQKSEAQAKLDYFIKNNLGFYSELKNDPNQSVTSNLSPYLHFGFISSQRVAIEVVKSIAARVNKEAYLEELIVRKELADNFCLYNKNYKTLEGISEWAKETLNAHREDIRAYTYNLEEFEHAKTHDELWNAIQRNLLKTGRIHGYLRMYWAKKILEWVKTPEDALKIAIYLNDEYALDGNDPNGYVGILWSITGVHDRPFANRLITGKIRYMSFDGCKKKFDISKYIKNS